MSLGRAEDSQSEVERALPVLQRLRRRDVTYGASIALAAAAMAFGQWSDARNNLDAATFDSVEIHAMRALVDYELGEFEDGRVHREQMLDLARARAEKQGCVRSQTTRRSETTYAVIDSLELVAISVINPCQRARNSRRWSGSGT